jgi:GT2 family glycosyltransferase
MITDFAPAISVIIPCRGKVAPMLREQLLALAGQDFAEPWELLIADNGITDDVTVLLDQFSSRLWIRVIDAHGRPGRGYAINQAVRQAGADRLLMLDSDDVVDPGYLREMANALDHHDFVGARLDSESLNPSWLRGRRQPLQSVRLDALLDHRTTVIGAGMALNRSAFDKVDGFDDDLLALEDLDVSFRLHQAGIEPVFAPDAVVRYRYRRSYVEIFRQERSYSRNEVLLHLKHREELAPRRLRRTLRGWLDVVLAVAGVSTRTGRAQLATTLGAAVGRIEGSRRYGILHL